MGRQKKERKCRVLPGTRLLKPPGVPLDDNSIFWLEKDEFEAMRLCDMERYDQQEAGEKMDVSRGTVQRLLRSGRRKVVEALLYDAALGVQTDEEE
jgi:predicted DNA-binding protein (UPF0251 family)